MPKMILIDVHSACWKKLKSPHLILSKCVIFSQSINELFHDDMSEIAVQEISKCIQSILHSEGNQTKCTSLRNSITPSCLCHLTFINLGDLLSQRRVHGTNLFNVTFKLLYILMWFSQLSRKSFIPRTQHINLVTSFVRLTGQTFNHLSKLRLLLLSFKNI